MSSQSLSILTQFSGSTYNLQPPQGYTKSTCLLALIHGEKCVCTPVLLSGMSSLIIDNNNMNLSETLFSSSLENTLHLPKDTTDPFVYIICGSLPTAALIHIRQFSFILQLGKLGPNYSYFIHLVLILQSSPQTGPGRINCLV